jgi:hypothetical protein
MPHCAPARVAREHPQMHRGHEVRHGQRGDAAGRHQSHKLSPASDTLPEWRPCTAAAHAQPHLSSASRQPTSWRSAARGPSASPTAADSTATGASLAAASLRTRAGKHCIALSCYGTLPQGSPLCQSVLGGRDEAQRQRQCNLHAAVAHGARNLACAAPSVQTPAPRGTAPTVLRIHREEEAEVWVRSHNARAPVAQAALVDLGGRTRVRDTARSRLATARAPAVCRAAPAAS